MTFTTQSESVPLVDAIKFATGCPLIFTGSFNTSDVNASTSGRPESFALIVHQPLRPGELAAVADRLNRARCGTAPASPDRKHTLQMPRRQVFGASKLNFKPGPR